MVYTFSHQKIQFGNILEGIGMKNVGIFYDYWEYFTAIWYVLWQFVTFSVICYIFPILVRLDQEKSGNPGFLRTTRHRWGTVIS
jgi:hypothetical protein